MGLCKSNSYSLNTFFFSIFLIHVCYSTPHLSLSFHWIVLKLVLNIQETLKKHTIIVRLYFFRVDGPQRRSHSSTGHLPSRGPSHRLGGSRSHLQGSVAAAHPLHSCRPGEVRSHLVSYFRAFIQLFAECRCWASSPVCSGTTLCSGTSWVFGGCSRSCSTAGLYRCRGNTSSPARQMLLSGDYATTWPSWSTTCSITYR